MPMSDSKFAVVTLPTCLVGGATPERRPHMSFNFNVSVFGVVRRSASLTLSQQLRRTSSQSSRSAVHIGRPLQVVATTADAGAPQRVDDPQSSDGAESLDSTSSSESYDSVPEAGQTTLDPAPTASTSALQPPTTTTNSSSTTTTSRAAATGRIVTAPRAGSTRSPGTTSAAAPTAASSKEPAAGYTTTTTNGSSGDAAGVTNSSSSSSGSSIPGGAAGSAGSVERGAVAGGGEAGNADGRKELKDQEGGEEEVASSGEERELVAMQARCWCAACHKDIPWTAAKAGGGGILTCAGCHRCYHTACVHKQRLGTGWRASLPGFLQQLPLFGAQPWYHCDACQQISDNFATFVAQGEVEMPGIREAMLDAETEEDIPYYTLQLFQPSRKPDLPTDPSFRKLVGVLRRHAPLYVPLVTPQDCMDFDYGLLVMRDSKPVAAAMFDVYGELVGATPLYGARDLEARECLMELWAEVGRDCGLMRLSVQVPADDYEQQLMLKQDHGFEEMDKEVLGALSKDIPAFAEELQVGTSYLARDLFTSPEILKSPDDIRDKMVQLAVNEEVVEKVGRNDKTRMRPRDE